jgi:hypothetical protein
MNLPSTLLRSNFAWVEAALQSGHGCVTFRRQEVAKIQTKTPYGSGSRRRFARAGSTAPCPAGYTAGDLQLRGQTFLLRIRNLVPFVDPVDDNRMPNTDPYEAV